MSCIAVDIDSTLYDFSTPMRQAFLDLALEHGDKEEYFRGGYQSWVEWRSPADVCGMEAFLEALDRVHSTEVILTQTPYDHSHEVLWELVEEGHTLVYASNRDPKTEDATAEWLFDIHAYPEGKLHCAMDDKLPFIEDCQYLIDDRPKTLVEFVYDYAWDRVENGPRKAFGLLFEYNRALTDVPNVYLAPTWLGVRYYLQRKGVLDGRRSISTGV